MAKTKTKKKVVPKEYKDLPKKAYAIVRSFEKAPGTRSILDPSQAQEAKLVSQKVRGLMGSQTKKVEQSAKWLEEFISRYNKKK